MYFMIAQHDDFFRFLERFCLFSYQFDLKVCVKYLSFQIENLEYIDLFDQHIFNMHAWTSWYLVYNSNGQFPVMSLLT